MKTRIGAILHSGNILNNGYLQCKYLRSNGVTADCINVDYSHSQGQPEWTESRFEKKLPDWDIDLSRVATDFARPDWYFQGNQRDLVEYSHARRPFFTRMLEKLNTRVSSRYLKSNRWEIDGFTIDKGSLTRRHLEFLLNSFSKHFPSASTPLSVRDILEYYPRANAQSTLVRDYSILHGYALDSIYGMISAPNVPFLCHEHGHLRDFPFEDSARGRLYALSLKLAKKVIITNSDCISSAHRLELKNTIFIPHLVDDEKFKPETTSFRSQLMQEFDCDRIIVAPARHHWKELADSFEGTWTKGNDVIVKGVAKMLQRFPDLNLKLIFFEWGQEVEDTKRLIRELELDAFVVWRPLCSKPVLKDYLNAADVVLDQFNKFTGSFGAIVPESMACAKPVMLNFNPDVHHWCYPELPPVCNAYDDESLSNELSKLLMDEQYKNQTGEAGYKWYKKYHSSSVVTDKIIDVYHEINDEFG